MALVLSVCDLGEDERELLALFGIVGVELAWGGGVGVALFDLLAKGGNLILKLSLLFDSLASFNCGGVLAVGIGGGGDRETHWLSFIMGEARLLGGKLLLCSSLYGLFTAGEEEVLSYCKGSMGDDRI